MLKPQNKIRAFRKVFFALYFRRPLSLDRYNGCSKEDVRSMYGERPRAVEIVHATADELTSPVRQLRLAFGRRKKKSQWLMEITSEYVFVSCWDYTNWGAVQGSALQLFTAALKDAPDLALDGVQLGVTDLFENDARAAPLTDIFLPDSPYLTKAYTETNGLAQRLSLNSLPLCGRTSPRIAHLDIRRSALRKASWLLPNQLHVRHTQSVNLHDDTPLITTAELQAGNCSVVTRLFAAMYEDNTALLRNLLRPPLLRKLGLTMSNCL